MSNLEIQILRSNVIRNYHFFVENILHKKLPSVLAEDIVDRAFIEWNKQHRKYHSLQHLNKLVNLIIQKEASEENQSILIILALYHDVYYEIGYAANEPYSAQYMINDFKLITKNYDEALVTKLCNIIFASEHTKYKEVDLNDYISRQFLSYDLYAAFGCKNQTELIENEKLIFQEFQRYSINQYLTNREILLNRFFS